MKKAAGWIIEKIRKNKEIIAYLAFGAATTLVNVAVYFLTYNIFKIPNVPSTIIAWVAAVIFAYITNKIWVFESRSYTAKTLIWETLSFFGCRAATGALDVLIMFLAVDKMGWNGTLWKILSNIIVIIINYVASKFLIFRKKEKKGEEDGKSRQRKG